MWMRLMRSAIKGLLDEEINSTKPFKARGRPRENVGEHGKKVKERDDERPQPPHHRCAHHWKVVIALVGVRQVQGLVSESTKHNALERSLPSRPYQTKDRGDEGRA